MKGWVLAVGLAAVALTTGAKAADLEEGPPPSRYGAYGDPRYGDMYRYPPRAPIPRAPVYEEDEEYVPGPGPRRYSYDPRDPRMPNSGRCAPRELIRDRLVSQGWQDFREGELRGEFVTLHARRPSGRPFLLTIERCSGAIVDARPVHLPGPYAYQQPGPYGYGPPPPRRWDRRYY